MKKEIVLALGAAAAVGVAGANIVNPQIRDFLRIQRPDQPAPISGPAVPGQDEHLEQEKNPRRLLVEEIIKHNPHLQVWRSNLEEPSVVLIDVYQEVQQGIVQYSKGVNVRNAPDASAARAGISKDFATPIESRIIFWVQKPNAQEIWAVVGEVMMETVDNPPTRYIFPQFSVVDLFDNEGRSIAFTRVESKNVRFERFNWGKSGLVKIDDREGLP